MAELLQLPWQYSIWGAPNTRDSLGRLARLEETFRLHKYSIKRTASILPPDPRNKHILTRCSARWDECSAMLPSILALQRTRMPPLAGLRSVPKIHLAQGKSFEDPRIFTKSPRQIVEPRQSRKMSLTAGSGPSQGRQTFFPQRRHDDDFMICYCRIRVLSDLPSPMRRSAKCYCSDAPQPQNTPLKLFHYQ